MVELHQTGEIEVPEFLIPIISLVRKACTLAQDSARIRFSLSYDGQRFHASVCAPSRWIHMIIHVYAHSEYTDDLARLLIFQVNQQVKFIDSCKRIAKDKWDIDYDDPQLTSEDFNRKVLAQSNKKQMRKMKKII